MNPNYCVKQRYFALRLASSDRQQLRRSEVRSNIDIEDGLHWHVQLCERLRAEWRFPALLPDTSHVVVQSIRVRRQDNGVVTFRHGPGRTAAQSAVPPGVQPAKRYYHGAPPPQRQEQPAKGKGASESVNFDSRIGQAATTKNKSYY